MAIQCFEKPIMGTVQARMPKRRYVLLPSMTLLLVVHWQLLIMAMWLPTTTEAVLGQNQNRVTTVTRPFFDHPKDEMDDTHTNPKHRHMVSTRDKIPDGTTNNNLRVRDGVKVDINKKRQKRKKRRLRNFFEVEEEEEIETGVGSDRFFFNMEEIETEIRTSGGTQIKIRRPSIPRRNNRPRRCRRRPTRSIRRRRKPPRRCRRRRRKRVTTTPSLLPSAFPSLSSSPSVSKAPSGSPTSSSAPSVSKAPSTVPSLVPSAFPSETPSSVPSVPPSTSAAPSDLQSE
eukprot:scaffold140341_cov40-Attheya_sp.AAC.1